MGRLYGDNGNVLEYLLNKVIFNICVGLVIVLDIKVMMNNIGMVFVFTEFFVF